MTSLLFPQLLQKALNENEVPPWVASNFLQLYETYTQSLKNSHLSTDQAEQLFAIYLDRLQAHIRSPFEFQTYHERVRFPFDHYKFGLDFIRPLVDEEKSSVLHFENVKKMNDQIEKNENVILFANHQTEVDPQLLTVTLEKDFPRIAEEIIFVAGDRVINDPLAVPLSMGCNLLCIYSKRHIENPPEKKHEKQIHNQRTMKKMKELLERGGRIIYVALSGGRDRSDESGNVTVAEFDAQSLEMFRLMAKQAGVSCHFYPLALATFDILPPPPAIEKNLGESRKAKREGIFFSFGDEIDMENYPGSNIPDRHERRALLATHSWYLVKKEYDALQKIKFLKRKHL